MIRRAGEQGVAFEGPLRAGRDEAEGTEGRKRKRERAEWASEESDRRHANSAAFQGLLWRRPSSPPARLVYSWSLGHLKAPAASVVHASSPEAVAPVTARRSRSSVARPSRPFELCSLLCLDCLADERARSLTAVRALRRPDDSSAPPLFASRSVKKGQTINRSRASKQDPCCVSGTRDVSPCSARLAPSLAVRILAHPHTREHTSSCDFFFLSGPHRTTATDATGPDRLQTAAPTFALLNERPHDLQLSLPFFSVILRTLPNRARDRFHPEVVNGWSVPPAPRCLSIMSTDARACTLECILP